MATRCGSMRSRGWDRSSTAECSRAGSNLLPFFFLLLFLLFSAGCGLGLFRLRRQRPIRLEDISNLLRDPFVRDDDADLAAPVEFQFAQALATDECRRPIPHNRPHVEAQIGQLSRFDAIGTLSELAEHSNLHTRLGALCEEAKHEPVAHLGVVDEELLF